MADDTILILTQIIGQLYSSILGSGAMIGIFLLIMYVTLMFYLGLPAEIVILLAIPLIYLLVGTGLPEYAMPLIILATGILITFAIMRIMRR